MPEINIHLKGWSDRHLYHDAVNDSTHPLHAAAWAVHARSFLAWEPGDETYLAVHYAADGADDHAILEHAFERFNIGDPATDEIVGLYRDAGHRSLSVGDVVVIDGRAYTCASCGWDRIDFPTSSSPK